MPIAAEMTGSGVPLAALAAAGALVLVQLLVPEVCQRVSPGSAWFQSLAGGLAVAYVFARLLPDLAASATATPADLPGGLLGLLADHAFLVALAGLLAYYAVLDWAQDGERREQRERGGTPTPARVGTGASSRVRRRLHRLHGPAVHALACVGVV